jgi:hypothetical protein
MTGLDDNDIEIILVIFDYISMVLNYVDTDDTYDTDQ